VITTVNDATAHACALARLLAAALAVGSVLLIAPGVCASAGDTADAPGGTEVPSASGSEAQRALFDSEADSEVLKLVEPDSREALANALADAGRNWCELVGALEQLQGEERRACLWLMEGMPHLDRLEMTALALVEHVEYAFRARDEMPYDIPEEMFEPYILTYRIEEEPVGPWRASLFERFAEVAKREGDVRGTARALNRELGSALREIERQFFGPRQSPLLTLRSGRGTQAEVAILACAALKAVGIPSRQASVAALGAEKGGAHWIELYDGTRWLPMFPLEPDAFGDFGRLERERSDNVTVVGSRSSFERVLVTESYTETGTVEFSFVDAGEPAGGFEHFALAVLNDGALSPLDALEAVADEDGGFVATVGDGRYVALAGVRDEEGNPFVMMQDATVDPGRTVKVAFDVTPRGQSRGVDPEALSRLRGALTVVFLFDPRSEPSARMLPLVAGEVARRGGAARLVCVHRGEADDSKLVGELAGSGAEVVRLEADAALFESDDGVVTPFPVDRDAYPAIDAYVSDTGERALEHQGYDLNIARRLGAALDDALAALLD